LHWDVIADGGEGLVIACCEGLVIACERNTTISRALAQV
jgi:hypothetical protein